MLKMLSCKFNLTFSKVQNLIHRIFHIPFDDINTQTVKFIFSLLILYFDTIHTELSFSV